MAIFAAAIVLTVGTLVFTLFVRLSDIPEPPPPDPTLHLDEKKARIYENLRDLQFEYRLGKLSDADYLQTKLGLQQELAGVLAELDALKVAPGAEPKAAAAPKPDGKTCPHCAATFAIALKFCGQCGKSMT